MGVKVTVTNWGSHILIKVTTKQFMKLDPTWVYEPTETTF